MLQVLRWNRLWRPVFGRSSSTFISFYFKDYWTSEADADVHHLGPFVSAGMIVPARVYSCCFTVAKYVNENFMICVFQLSINLRRD